MKMYFELIGEILAIEMIAEGSRIHRLADLEEAHGRGRWRKLKGVARVRLVDGSLVMAEVHWYEAHGIGRRRLKIKRFLD
jgi:hypothetical protein